MPRPNRRKRYFIDKRIQGMWAFLNLIIAGVIVLLIGLEVMRSFYVQFGWPIGGTEFFAVDTLFIAKLLLLTVLGGGFFWLLSAFAAHRFTGPIYKLNISMLDLAKGNYNMRIQFRKKDYFQELAESFNSLADSIEKTITEKDIEIAKLKSQLGKQ